MIRRYLSLQFALVPPDMVHHRVIVPFEGQAAGSIRCGFRNCQMKYGRVVIKKMAKT